MTAIGLLNPPTRSALLSAKTAPVSAAPRADAAFADLLAERMPAEDPAPPEKPDSDPPTEQSADGRNAEPQDDQPEQGVPPQSDSQRPDTAPGSPILQTPEPSTPSGKSDPVVTIRDVAKELIHAASIDLAAMAKQELVQPKTDKHPGTPDAPLSRPPRHEPLTASGGMPTRTADQPGTSLPTDAPIRPANPGIDPTPRQSMVAEVAPERPASPGFEPNLIQRPIAPIQQPAAKAIEPSPSTTIARGDLLTRLTGSAEAARGAVSAVDRAAIQPGLRQDPGVGSLNRPSESAGRTNRDAILQTVQRGLASMLSQGGGRMTVVLRPEHLGEVRVQLDARGGTVNARLTAETEAARRTLESGADQLRTSLESKGVRVESIRIEGPGSEAGHSGPGHEDADPRSPSGQRGHDRHEERSGRGDHRIGEQNASSHDQPGRTGIWTDIGIDTIV